VDSMKVRDSGMPGEEMWRDFFDPTAILSKLGFEDVDGDVVDFGCGYGTFALAAAASAKGTVHALDVDPEMIAATTRRAEALRLSNVRPVLCDFVENGTDLPDASVRYAMLFNILHAERPLPLTREAFRVLAPGGKLAAIHWIHDASTPRGPALSIRPRPEQCQQWLVEVGFELILPLVSLPPYH
jgi:ubiquinone/menaquinone biosynthesis C-methylase UbiE